MTQPTIVTFKPPHPLSTLLRLPSVWFMVAMVVIAAAVATFAEDDATRGFGAGYLGFVLVLLAWVVISGFRVRLEIAGGVMKVYGATVKPKVVVLEQLTSVLEVEKLKLSFGATTRARFLLNDKGEAEFVWLERGWTSDQWEQFWMMIGRPPAGFDPAPATMAGVFKRYPHLLSAAKTAKYVKLRRIRLAVLVLIIVVSFTVSFIINSR